VSYLLKEVYYTLQGEGARAGRPAVLLRFAGCNLWSGREQDRQAAICTFCDTDFVGTDGPSGGKYAEPGALSLVVRNLWPPGVVADPYVVCTGGEPLLQLDEPLVAALHGEGFEVAVETNGTLPLPRGIDWVTVSPKAGANLVLDRGDELKLVYPQRGASPERFERLAFDHFLLQPMDGAELERNTRLATEYCLAHPRWRLSLQLHKLLGIP